MYQLTRRSSRQTNPPSLVFIPRYSFHQSKCTFLVLLRKEMVKFNDWNISTSLFGAVAELSGTVNGTVNGTVSAHR